MTHWLDIGSSPPDESYAQIGSDGPYEWDQEAKHELSQTGGAP